MESSVSASGQLDALSSLRPPGMKQRDWDTEVHGAIKNFLLNQRLASKYVPREAFAGAAAMVIGDDELSKHVISVNKRWVPVSECATVPGAAYGELLEPGSARGTAAAVLRAYEAMRERGDEETEGDD